jgi:hypothetical protein
MILGRYKQSDGIGVACIWEGMGQIRNGNKFLIGKLERKRLRGRPGCKFMDNFKVNLKNIGGCGIQPPK